MNTKNAPVCSNKCIAEANTAMTCFNQNTQTLAVHKQSWFRQILKSMRLSVNSIP